MKDLDKLEAQFRSEVDGYKPTPPAFIWDEINKELLKEKKSKKRVYFWIFLGLSFCSIIIGYRSSSLSTHHNTANLSNPNKSAIYQHSKEEHDEKMIDKGATQTTSNVSEIVKINDSEAIKQTGQIHNDLNHRASFGDVLIIPRTEKMIREKPAIHSTALRLKDTTSAVGAESYKLNDQNGAGHQSTAITGATKLNTQNAIHGNLSLEDIKLQDQFTTNMDYLPLLSRSVLISNSPNNPLLTLDYSIQKNKLILADEKLRYKGFFIEVGILIGRHNTNLRSEVSIDSFYRSNSESNWYTWGAKARVGWRQSESFFVKTGIDFIESRDKFDFRGQHLFPSSNQLSPDAIRFFSVGDVTYRQLNIPLTLGAEKTYGKFFFGLEGSLLFNFNFKVKGKIQTGLESISRAENLDIYKNRLGFGYTGALILGAKLKGNNSIYFKPTYAKYMSTTSVDNADVTSNLIQLYLEIGFRTELR